MLYLGTSGFSYDDWVGPFYPPGLPRQERLIYYAREFNTCEVNSTYYALPRPSIIQSMMERTEDGFMFVFKANQDMTHQREDNAAVFEAFRDLMAPVTEAGKLGCVLAQFPYSFTPGPSNREYLETFRERMGPLPVVVELRNVGWITDDLFGWLRERDLGFCCVDEPRLPRLMPPLAEATSGVGYVRFHGRNAAKWWRHEFAWQRYDYTYSPDELAEWVPRIGKLIESAENTFVFANNHWHAQAVNSIRQLRLMLD
jgi:uncharacterized protein YecE (DUF72 family)